jgi:hypothetical protein
MILTREIRPSATFFARNDTRTDLGSKLSLRGEMLATTRLPSFHAQSSSVAQYIAGTTFIDIRKIPPLELCPASDACSHFHSKFLRRILTPSSPSVPHPSSTERNNVFSYSCSNPTYFYGMYTGKPLPLPLPLPLPPISNRLDSTKSYHCCCTFGAFGIKYIISYHIISYHIKSRQSQRRVKPNEWVLKCSWVKFK